MELRCVVCQSHSPKYKCSGCYYPYCSSVCWKVHKNSGDCKTPIKITEKIDNIKKEKLYVTQDTIPPEKLEKLCYNNDLKQILKDPLLQKLLIGVDNSPEPYEAVQKAMQDSTFIHFVDLCLGIVEESEENNISAV